MYYVPAQLPISLNQKTINELNNILSPIFSNQEKSKYNKYNVLTLISEYSNESSKKDNN